MSEAPCAKCGKPLIAACGGRGHIQVDDTTVKPCPNIYRRQLMQHLGSEIASVVHATSTPLLRLNPEGGEPIVDLTKKNLFIEDCTWRGLLPHLKYALSFKGLMFFFRVITDERIRNVFVGSESYKARSSKVRDDLDTYNNLADLVGADYDLVIIKLGYLGYKNQAAPGALKEALLHRESIGKPTWILLDPGRDWVHSQDPDVYQYIQERFETISIQAIDPKVAVPVIDVGMPSLEEQLANDDEPPDELGQLVIEDEPASPEPALSNDIGLPGDDQPYRRRPSSNRRWRR